MDGGFEKLADLQESLDPSGMLGLTTAFPQHMDDAWRRGKDFARGLEKTPASNLVVCGMGGSAIGGDMASAFLGDRLRVPMRVNRSFDVPTSLERPFFVFSSYSGNTGETLSAYRSIRGTGVPVVGISSGGELSALCREDGYPVCDIPGGMPPRAAIAYSFFPLLQILSATGLATVSDDEWQEAREGVQKVCESCAKDGDENFAASLAYQLRRKLPVIYSSDGLLSAVARRWSTQFNENSKSLAHYAIFPELTHNEIVGWRDVDSLREVLVISLEDEEDHAMARKQTAVAIEIIEPLCAGVVRVDGFTGGRMKRMLSAMLLGDFASVYLAFLNGVDPTPVENIDFLKGRLKELD